VRVCARRLLTLSIIHYFIIDVIPDDTSSDTLFSGFFATLSYRFDIITHFPPRLIFFIDYFFLLYLFFFAMLIFFFVSAEIFFTYAYFFATADTPSSLLSRSLHFR